MARMGNALQNLINRRDIAWSNACDALNRGDYKLCARLMRLVHSYANDIEAHISASDTDSITHKKHKGA